MVAEKNKSMSVNLTYQMKHKTRFCNKEQAVVESHSDVLIQPQHYIELHEGDLKLNLCLCSKSSFFANIPKL